ASTRRAIAAVQARGPRCVLATSMRTEDTPHDAIDMVVGEGGTLHQLRTPRLELSINGAGDALAALFLFHYLRGGTAGEALAEAGSAIHGLLVHTARAGARELQMVAAQDEFVAPSRRFLARPC
ncbi:MAG: bifunctional hydroxymethylpyrimidine kinase/phosphomethylpyrimidine kinase, partial [Rhodospirillales bacterium]|nr:bifunctional hydroxymethylpyrimidine kinase/phosphomethylpyrimidine kinase [Rhodospirillales bacterium]